MLLLTGATGFLGRHLTAALLDSGQPLKVLVRPTSDLSALPTEGLTFVEGDLLDPESILEALEGVDTVVHAAAVVSFQARDRKRMHRTAEEGTANLVNMMLEAGTKHLVHVSSVAALNRKNDELTTADNNWAEAAAKTAYSRAKIAAEREVWRGRAEGLSVSVLYPSIVLGTGDWTGENTPALWRRAATGGRFYPLGTAGFVAVEDVVKAILLMVERREDGERWLLNGANWSWRELLTKIAASVGAAAPSVGLKPWQSALLWPVEWLRSGISGRPPLITRESQRNAQARYAYDGSPITALAGFGEYRDVEEAIRRIGKSYKKRPDRG